MCYALDRDVVAEKADLLYGELMGRFWFPTTHPSMNNWTQQIQH